MKFPSFDPRCSSMGIYIRAAVLLTSVANAGCAVAPGMRMNQQAIAGTHQPGAEQYSASAESNPSISMTEIDGLLLTKLRQEDSDSAAEISKREALPADSARYTLGPGDVLQITVWDHPELAQAQGASTQANARAADPIAGFVVDQDGNLRFPYAGTLHVQAQTAEQVQASLTKALGHSYRNPQVTVRVSSYRSKQIYVDGEVHSPGSLPLNDIPMSLYDAISRAGGFSGNADQSRMTVVRAGKSYPLDLSRMLELGQNPSEIQLADGDLLRIGARADFGVFVMGEVNKPVMALPPKSGQLTLSDALMQAESINPNTSDPAQFYVIRGTKGGQARVFHLNAASPVAMVLANQFVLHPKDIVFVDGSSLVRLNRVLSLLLPVINTGLTAAILAK